MTRQIFLLLLVLALVLGCERKQEQPRKQAPLAAVGDRSDNGGILRFTVEGKTMHDRFVVAQFTPRGDLFTDDNLQIYNYDIQSDKYPRLLISINNRESDLRNWTGKNLPVELLAFTVSALTPPLTTKGEARITRVDDSYVEGQFRGELVNEENGKFYEIRGEFKAVMRLNV
ncbi:MAG TPA: hypothetical protein PLG50_09495 [bacterium]|nr:hypothetical protein [bacterium]HQG45882.1 hypothetical protein [bacterium]HQI48338.1 hypothetical protein [bacterium]HQJ63440.1 hypothetical protein [bacterium]